MFRIMKSQLGSLLKQAFTTFSCKPDAFQSNLNILKSQMEQVTVKDLDIHPALLNETFWQRPDKAPVTYIDIYDDTCFTMGVFILKPGMKLPLHDHPQMHGLIRVIYGKVKITSYSLNTPKTQEADKTAKSTDSLVSYRKSLTVERCPEVILDSQSSCCLLEPNNRNLHEIETLNGSPAAFIDILSPPYETLIEGNGIRQCNYYEVKQELMPGVFRLLEVESPSWYWTDSYCYDGTDL